VRSLIKGGVHDVGEGCKFYLKSMKEFLLGFMNDHLS
jgi:hypothetical protein